MATSYRKTLILVVDDAALYPSNLIYPSDELFPGARNITNIVVGSLKLDEILSESPIQFGQMYATKFEVQVYLEEDLSGKWIQVYQYNGNGVYTEIFSGKIDSCKLDKVGTDRTIIAYDKAYTFGQINIAQWWNGYWDNRQSATLKQVREAMLTEFGIDFDTTKSLINDSLVVTNTASFDGCSLTDMLRMMCELSACFPHIGRGGVLEYITFASNATAKDLTDKYEWMNSDFEDFETDYVTGVQFYDSGNELKWTVGTTTNAYPIQKNIFLYFADTATLNTVGTNIYNAIKDIKYTPSSLKMITSDFGIKLGDYVSTAHGNFYVLENSYSGSQLWEQTIKATGDQKQYDGTPTFDYGEIVLNEKIARVNFSIEGLETEFTTKMTGLFANYKGQYIPTTSNSPASDWTTDALKRQHVGEVFCYYTTDSEGKVTSETYYRWDYTNGTYGWTQLSTTNGAYSVISSTFKQTNDAIETEVSRATGVEESIFANYKGDVPPTTSNYPASSWTTNTEKANHVGETYYNTSKTPYKYYKWVNTGTSSSPVYQWQGINTNNYGDFYVVSSQIKQTADAIELKVNKTDVVSELNSRLRLTADYILMETAGKIIITAGNFQVDASGNITATNATLRGTFDCGSDTTGSARLHLDGGDIEFYYSGNTIGKICARTTSYSYDEIIIEEESLSGNNDGEITLEEEEEIVLEPENGNEEEIIIENDTTNVSEAMVRIGSDGSIIIAADDLGTSASISSGCYIVLNQNSNSSSSEKMILQCSSLDANITNRLSFIVGNNGKLLIDDDNIYVGNDTFNIKAWTKQNKDYMQLTYGNRTAKFGNIGLTLDGGLYCDGSITCEGEISATQANINGTVYCNDINIDNGVTVDNGAVINIESDSGTFAVRIINGIMYAP